MLFDLFKKKKVEPEYDFSSVKVDMHSHVIPGIDDGAQNLEQSIHLIKQFIDLGYSKIITTPHIMSDYYRNTPDIILKGLEIVREEVEKQNLNIEIEAAAEYYLDEAFQNKLKAGNALSFGDNYLLFELSFVSPPPNLPSIIKMIKDYGYKPVLAHPERYHYFKNGIDDYYLIRDQGCYFQMNSISLIGYYNKITQKIAQELVNNGMIDFIGSDMHHLKHASALKESLNSGYLKTIIEDGNLLNDTL